MKIANFNDRVLVSIKFLEVWHVPWRASGIEFNHIALKIPHDDFKLATTS